MPKPQIIILSRDPMYSVLLEMTVREFRFVPKLTAMIERVEQLSGTAPTVGWFIDLDALPFSVDEIAERARKNAPDAKLVFLATRITREIALACVRQRVIALLVKPIEISRLIGALNEMRRENELLDEETVISQGEVPPDPAAAQPGSQAYRDHPILRMVDLKCPICRKEFPAVRFKMWTVSVHDTDTDFCPICPETIHPELYSIAVCPDCLFSHYFGKFPETKVNEGVRSNFLLSDFREERKRTSMNLDFRGERTLVHGIKSFELAADSSLGLKLPGALKLAGEFHLKCSWLCRRLGHSHQERQAQERSLDCMKRCYEPYLRHDGVFPADRQIQTRMGPGMETLSERAIVVTGFLVGELSRRLGLLEQAQTYFDEVLTLPFFHRFSSLSSHVHHAVRLFQASLKTQD